MKKVFLLLLLSLSKAAFADAGFFLDGTTKYASTGIIQQSYPEIALITCPSVKTCERFVPGNPYAVVVYSNIPRMKAEIKKRASGIDSAAHFYNVRGDGFKIIVDGIFDKAGVGYLMLGVKTARKKTTSEQNIAIAEAITNEISLAYARLGY